MLDILLVIHIVISVLLVIVILLQRSGSDSLAGLGGSNNMGLVTARSAANFFTKLTILLAILFMVNSLLLANLSNKASKGSNITKKLQEEIENKNAKQQLPMAK